MICLLCAFRLVLLIECHRDMVVDTIVEMAATFNTMLCSLLEHFRIWPTATGIAYTACV